MKAAKLLNEYSGLPSHIKKGNIVYYDPKLLRYYTDLNISKPGIYFEDVENYPDVWEQLNFNFEILAFKTWAPDTTEFKLNSNGVYMNQQHTYVTLFEALKNLEIHIPKVRNTQTGEVFEINSAVNSVHTKGSHFIKSFRLDRKSLRLVVHTSWTKENRNGQPFGDISLLKEAQVHTEDGKVLQKHDTYYKVEKGDDKVITVINALDLPDTDKYDCFAKEKNAYKYIKKNKKLFSYNEIKTIYQDAGKRLYSFMDKIEEITHHRTK